MGGEGAMMQANASSKYNRSLMSKRKDRKLSFVHTNTEKTEYNLPKSTPETLSRIQEKVIRENELRKQKRLILIGLFTVILISTFVYIML